MVVLLLFISVLVKAYVLKSDYTNYIAELVVIVLSVIYVSVRSMMAGNNLMDTSKRNKTICILGTLGMSIIITVINGVKNYANYGEHYSGLFDWHFLAALAITFISSFVLISVGLLFIYVTRKDSKELKRN